METFEKGHLIDFTYSQPTLITNIARKTSSQPSPKQTKRSTGDPTDAPYLLAAFTCKTITQQRELLEKQINIFQSAVTS